MKAMFFRLALLVLLLALVALLVPSGMIISTGYAEFEFVVPGQTPAPEEETTETVSGFEDVDAGYLAPLVGGVDPLPIDKSPGYAPDPNGYLSDREYRDDSIAVRIVEGRAYDTTYLVAYVTVADASQIRTTVAGRHNSEDTVRGAVMASDAFFPFPDCAEAAAKAGIACIIQPGGSVRDDLVIEAADAHGMVMAFTGMRLFHH